MDSCRTAPPIEIIEVPAVGLRSRNVDCGHPQAGILRTAAGLQLRERRRPLRAAGADAHKVADGLELILAALDIR